jgi:hypothetical protein
MTLITRRHGIAAILSLSLCVAGCASLRAASARHDYIEGQTREYVYAQPLPTVWPQARQMLFTEGFEVKDTDTSNAETEWKESGKERVRYLLSGIAVDDNSCRVQFTRAEEQKTKDGKWEHLDTDRDLGMEYKLIKKVDPDRAHGIESEADQKGEQAKKG